MSRTGLAVMRGLLFSCALLFASYSVFAATPPAAANRLDLRNGWQLQSDCVIQGSATGPAGLKSSGAPELDASPGAKAP